MSFDAYARQYDAALLQGLKLSGAGPAWFAEQRLGIVRERVQQLGVEVRTVIDYGCGVGNHIPFIAEVFPAAHITGVDIAEECLAEARRRHGRTGISFRTPEAMANQSPADLIHVNGVFHHIPAEEHDYWLTTLYGWLKPGGLLMVFDNNPLSLPARWVMSRIPFDHDAVMVWPWRLAARMRSAGFAVAQPHFHFILPRPLSALRTIERAVSRWPLGAQYELTARKPA